MLLECPSCGAIWGMEEIDWQQCDCCGYPSNDDGDDDDWDYDGIDDDDDDSNDPNDSRNI